MNALSFAERIKSQPDLARCMLKVMRMLAGRQPLAPWIDDAKDETQAECLLLRLPPPVCAETRQAASMMMELCGSGLQLHVVIDHSLAPHDWIMESPLGRAEVHGAIVSRLEPWTAVTVMVETGRHA